VSRVSPLEPETPEARALIDSIAAGYGRATNMKRTLARSPVALGALMSWYDLRAELISFLDERLVTLFAYSISSRTDCLVCSTFFRRILIERGESPEALHTSDWEQDVMSYGRQLAVDPNGVSDGLYARLAARLTPEQIITLTTFAGLMVATNLFNNALRVDLDPDLVPYRKEEDP